ncbi:MAG: hypothetical protein OIF57_10920 [Marinobacterium sp.]|nr:hypothetical protein [Marinobacterium sp.]
MLCQSPVKGLALCTLLQLWLFCWLFATAISPSYLVEGTRNTLGFQFPSKEAYVYTVITVQFIYYAVLVVLVGLTIRTVQGYWLQWRQR